jgi:hypothetical protein
LPVGEASEHAHLAEGNELVFMPGRDGVQIGVDPRFAELLGKVLGRVELSCPVYLGQHVRQFRPAVNHAGV